VSQVHSNTALLRDGRTFAVGDAKSVPLGLIRTNTVIRAIAVPEAFSKPDTAPVIMDRHQRRGTAATPSL
jgi:hypothetical protein